jgi:hypothetical protein
MKSILEGLFYGNVCPNTDCRSTDKETKELMSYIADHHDTLLKELTDKQKETLEKFDDCYNELTDINEREIFVYAFRLGARIAIEVLLPNIKKHSKDFSGSLEDPDIIKLCGCSRNSYYKYKKETKAFPNKKQRPCFKMNQGGYIKDIYQ